MEQKRFLVTGGAGFIGSHIVDRLVALNQEVYVIDNLSSGKMENVNRDSFFLRQSLLDTPFIESIHERFDVVIHMAALLSIERTLDFPLETFENNVIATLNTLKLALRTKANKLLYASTSEIYSTTHGPLSEDDETNPNEYSTYAAAKLAGETLFKSFGRKHGVPYILLRYFNVYGPRQESSRYGFVTGRFINRILNNKPPEIYGDGNQTRDFIFVKDSVEATLTAALRENVRNDVINVATGVETSINDLANVILKVSKSCLRPVYLTARTYDIKRRVANIRKMRKLLGFSPSSTLEEGMRLTFEWYKDRKSPKLHGISNPSE